MHLTLATDDDIPALAALHAAASASLTARHGRGPWSTSASERGIANQMRLGRIYVGREDGRIVSTLRLSTRKPWAIDPAYFTTSLRPLYLTDMAVVPERQGCGVGRATLAAAFDVAAAWPADAIRLDAYDAAAGAGPFYARCGYAERGHVTYRGTALIYYERLVGPTPPPRP